MGTASQLLASRLLRHFNMKPLILLGLVAFVRAQYSGETQDLSNSQLDALKDIFGDAAAGGAYSGQQVGRLEGGTNGVEAIIQVVKNEEGYVAPDDYQTTAGLTDKATTNVDNVFENCADYTPGVYASVSKGVCWIDYAMTCQFGQQSGSYSSYWGYSAQQCQAWMDGELSRLNQEVADMQNAGSLTGRKKAAALAKGLKAQETLNKYSQCNVFWQPIDAAPLTTGGNGYVDGGDLDISGFERKGPNVAQPSDSSAVKLTQGPSY